MNLRDLQYLVAVADHRHFGRAAKACAVSQPTLSTQLKKLEVELGVQLVERGGRAVILTPVGDQVVARARAVLAEGEAIRRIARQAQDPRAGRLALGAFPTIAPYLFPHVLGELRRQLPDVELLLVEDKTAALLAHLREGSLDAVVVALPVDEEGLHAEPLFREALLLAAPATHPSAGTPRRSGWRTSRGRACCCSVAATACASRPLPYAARPAPSSAPASGRPAWTPCGTWSRRASA